MSELSMSVEEREAFLADMHVGIMGIERTDGPPLTVPVWYLYAPGGEVVVLLDGESLKGRLLERARRFSLCAQDEQPPYRYVSVEGSATITPSDVERDTRPMARRYLGDEVGDRYTEHAPPGERPIRVAMRPERWFTVDYSKPAAVTIPSQVEDVTADWLSAATGLPVAGLAVEPIGVGVGLVGDLFRVTPAYDGAPDGSPTSLVVKLPSAVSANRAMGMQYRLYERENRFYEEIAPTAQLCVPRAWHCAMDPGSERFVLVLQDLSAYEVGDQLCGITPERAEHAVAALARFHAQWWEHQSLAELTWIPTPDDPTEMQAGDYYRQLWPAFVDRWGHALPPGGIDLGERVGDMYERILLEMARRPLTIAHADFRLDNLFFDGSTTVVIDWQLVGRNIGAYDVAYLLAQSMDEGARRAHGLGVLRSWHDALGAAGVRGYSWEQALRDYALSVLACLVIPVTTGAEIELGNERGERLVQIVAARGFAAALDADHHDVLDQLR